MNRVATEVKQYATHNHRNFSEFKSKLGDCKDDSYQLNRVVTEGTLYVRSIVLIIHQVNETLANGESNTCNYKTIMGHIV
jgi:hypothetical protein